MAQIVGCLEGMSEACVALDMPIVSGNVSLYNETKNDDGTGSAILPTPAIGAVGLLEDWEMSATVAFKAEGEHVAQIGLTAGQLGQSLWLQQICDRRDGPTPPVDLEAERRVGEFIRHLIENGEVTAVHDVSDGGILVALAEMALAGDIGAEVWDHGSPIASFGECQASYLVACKSYERLAELTALHGIGSEWISITGGKDLRFRPGGKEVTGRIPLADLRAAHEGFFPALMGADAALA